MVAHLDPSILPITSYKLTNTLILHQLKKAEIDVPSFLDGMCRVVISCDLWMYKMKQEIFKYQHITNVSLSGIMLISGCPSQHQLMVVFLQFWLVM